LNGFAIAFDPEKNLIFGANGSGKTSIIEALFLLGFGKSFLPVGRRELVNFNASGFFLSAEVLNNSGENKVTACLDRGFSLKLNEASSPLAQVSRYLYPLFFSHFLYSQTIDGVAHLRRLVDRFIYGLTALYLHDVLRYNTTLKQKNYLLKNLARTIHNSELNSWNMLLAETGSKIIEKRMAFTERLNAAINDIFGGALRMNYEPALLTPGPVSAAALLGDLERVRSSELRSRRSLIGPQRDRFEITVDGKKLQLFSSGEKKKFLVMLYMAFIELFRQGRSEYPVFLMDDYDAAMDENNLEYVLSHFPAMQVIATSVARNGRFANLRELKKET
jgi:DNA replication and repair protein RecF